MTVSEIRQTTFKPDGGTIFSTAVHCDDYSTDSTFSAAWQGRRSVVHRNSITELLVEHTLSLSLAEWKSALFMSQMDRNENKSSNGKTSESGV